MARKNGSQPEPVRPEQTQPQYRHLTDIEKFNLGMPLQAFGVSHSFEGIAAGHQWTGYRITNIGLIPLPPTILPNDPAEPIPEYPWPHWGIAYAGLGFVLMQLWLRIVTHTQSPAYVQARWSPQLGQTRIALLGLERCTTDKERSIALRADKLLRFDLSVGGRPPLFESRDDFIAAVFPLIQNTDRPSTDNIAPLLFPKASRGDAKRSLARQRQKWGWKTHQDLVRDAQQNQGRSVD